MANDTEYQDLVRKLALTGDSTLVPKLQQLRDKAQTEIEQLHKTMPYIDILLKGSLAQSNLIADVMLERVPADSILYPPFYLSLAFKLYQPYLLEPFLLRQPNYVSFDARSILASYRQLLKLSKTIPEFKTFILAKASVETERYHAPLYHMLGVSVKLTTVWDKVMVALLTDDLTVLSPIELSDRDDIRLGPILAELTDTYYTKADKLKLIEARGYLSFYVWLLRHITEPKFKTLNTLSKPTKQTRFEYGEVLKLMVVIYNQLKQQNKLNHLNTEINKLLSFTASEFEAFLPIDETVPPGLLNHLYLFLKPNVTINVNKPLSKQYVSGLKPEVVDFLEETIDAGINNNLHLILADDIKSAKQDINTWYLSKNPYAKVVLYGGDFSNPDDAIYQVDQDSLQWALAQFAHDVYNPVPEGSAVFIDINYDLYADLLFAVRKNYAISARKYTDIITYLKNSRVMYNLQDLDYTMINQNLLKANLVEFMY